MFMFSGETLGKNAVSWVLAFLVSIFGTVAVLLGYISRYDTGRYSGPISRCMVIVLVLKWALLWTATICWLITRLAAVYV